MLSNEDQPIITMNPPNPVAWGGAEMVTSEPTNPWNKVKLSSESPAVMNSFKDLMSEDLAKDLQQKEEQQLFSCSATEQSTSLIDFNRDSSDTSNDLFLALLLQHDFNKEHDSQIQREENHFNKNSKLSVSFSKYKVCQESEESDSEEDFQDDENRVLDCFEESRKTNPVIPACGYTRHNNQMVTKHDKTISGRRNAERVMSFPPGINTGDGGGFDMQISNKVYNKLARSAMSESRRKQRVIDKVDKATTEKALDLQTRLIVYKMVNNSILESVNGVVSTGKESIVFHAQGGTYEEQELPSECAVKVFKTTLTDFKTRERYIREDFRFKDRMSKNNNKMTIQLWAEKEFHNLRRLQKAKIPSPTPFLIRKHVLVMSFIGEGQMAAPKLKHIRLSYAEWCGVYEEIVDMMTTMFRVCKLVHGDMSEYNVLWHEGRCWIIDLGQAVEPLHPNALRFLHRDCSNVVGFFKSKGLSDLPTPLELFEKITEIDLPGEEEEAHRLIDEYEVTQELWRNGGRGTEDHFEELWNQTQRPEQVQEAVDALHLSQDEDVEEESKRDVAKGKRRKKKKKSRASVVTDDGGAETRIVADLDFAYVNAEDGSPAFQEERPVEGHLKSGRKTNKKETKCGVK